MVVAVSFFVAFMCIAPHVIRAHRYRQHSTARFTLCTACRYPLEPLGQTAGKCPECGRRYSFEHHPRLLRMARYTPH